MSRIASMSMSMSMSTSRNLHSVMGMDDPVFSFGNEIGMGLHCRNYGDCSWANETLLRLRYDVEMRTCTAIIATCIALLLAMYARAGIDVWRLWRSIREQPHDAPCKMQTGPSIADITYH